MPRGRPANSATSPGYFVPLASHIVRYVTNRRRLGHRPSRLLYFSYGFISSAARAPPRAPPDRHDWHGGTVRGRRGQGPRADHRYMIRRSRSQQGGSRAGQTRAALLSTSQKGKRKAALPRALQSADNYGIPSWVVHDDDERWSDDIPLMHTQGATPASSKLPDQPEGERRAPSYKVSLFNFFHSIFSRGPSSALGSALVFSIKYKAVRPPNPYMRHVYVRESLSTLRSSATSRSSSCPPARTRKCTAAAVWRPSECRTPRSS